MVDKYEASADKLTWTFTLRDGLAWHDGQPVPPEDCVASIKRWAVRDPIGQQMTAALATMKAIDAKTFEIVLKEPFGLVLEALGKPSTFMMPKKVAETDPFSRSTITPALGPLHLQEGRMEARREGRSTSEHQVQPRAEPPSMLAGGKVVKVDRVRMAGDLGPEHGGQCPGPGRDRPDRTSRADLFPLLKAEKNIELYGWNAQGSQIIMRFNHLQPPFTTT